MQLPPRAGFGPAKAGELEVAEQSREGPSTATEHRLAAAWAKVLGIPTDQIGRRDQFFALGGTSLSALRLVIALDRAMSFKDLIDHPILADQAELIDRRPKRGVPAPVPVGSGRSAATRTTTARGGEGGR